MCADLTLHAGDLVLPISLDFPEPLAEEADARIIGELDGITAPLVAISIPNRAYVGWFEELLPDLAGLTTRQELKNKATPHYRRAARERDPHWYIVDDRAKDAARFEKVEELYQRLEALLKHPLPGAIIFYKEVCSRKVKAS